MRVLPIAALAVAMMSLASCAKKQEVRTVQLGEKAVIGPFIYVASETQWPLSLGSRTPKDRFFLIKLSISNAGSPPATIPSFEIVDDQGNSFPEETSGEGVDQWLGLTRKIQEAQTERGTIIFDVMPKHYRLRVADENDNFMYIDIPLNLNSEEPVEKKLMESAPPQVPSK